jgi:hypothetical protein
MKGLQNSAEHHRMNVFESPICWYFRVYSKGQTKEFHCFLKM